MSRRCCTSARVNRSSSRSSVALSSHCRASRNRASGCAARDNAVERGEQGRDLALAPVQFLGNQEPIGRVLFAEREVADAAPRFPFSQTAPKIARHAGRALITVLGGLGEQLRYNLRDGAGDLL